MLSQRHLLVLILVPLFVLCHTINSYGELEYEEHDIWIYEDGHDRKVTVQLPEGTVIEYNNDEDCGEPDHTTENGGRFYRHLHITHSLPIDGVDNYDEDRTVTKDNINAYWNRAVAGRYGYPHYSQLSTADHTRNCAAHALMVEPWVQLAGAVLILQYDYRPNQGDIEEGNVLLYSGEFHMAYLKTLCPDPYYLYYFTVKEMTEKNTESGIYKSTFSCPGPVPEYPYEKLP